MTDAFQATGEASLVETISIASNDSAETMQNLVATPLAVEAVAEAPNGFLTLGLAPELIQAVKDLGFTQPTTVQLKTIPLAMQGAAGAEGAAPVEGAEGAEGAAKEGAAPATAGKPADKDDKKKDKDDKKK